MVHTDTHLGPYSVQELRRLVIKHTHIICLALKGVVCISSSTHTSRDGFLNRRRQSAFDSSKTCFSEFSIPPVILWIFDYHLRKKHPIISRELHSEVALKAVIIEPFGRGEVEAFSLCICGRTVGSATN